MNLDVLHRGSACTLRLKGRLVLGEPVSSFDDAVKASLGDDRCFLILDLGALEYIDSSGIGALVHTLQVSRAKGGDTVLVSPSSFVVKMLKMVHILNLFQIYDSEDDALAAANATPR